VPPVDSLPDDQAEVVFTEQSIDWLIDNVTDHQREDVVDTIVGLFRAPRGKHPLSNQNATNLVGFNTVEAAQREFRIIYRVTVANGVGLIEIVTIGQRRDDEVYSAADALVRSGKLTEEEQTQIWDALTLLDETKSRLGLEEWDYAEPPAPEGIVQAAVAAGLDEDFARLLSKDELVVAMESAWEDGTFDPAAGVAAAVQRIATSTSPDRILALRRDDRCGAIMPKLGKPCIRVKGHAGAHRGSR
jgi:hypothetical protein